jgi:hypothetical protein
MKYDHIEGLIGRQPNADQIRQHVENIRILCRSILSNEFAEGIEFFISETRDPRSDRYFD